MSPERSTFDAPAKSVFLIPKIARRVERGHLWVFSNEVQREEGEPVPGDEVAVFGHKGRFLGMALYSRSSLIRARIYSRKHGQPCDAPFIAGRLAEALALRRLVFNGALPHAYRLAHSESDGLPGAIIDVFGDHAVLQITTAGMDRRRDLLVAAIKNILNPAAIVERSDVPSRALEGLPETKAVLHGEPRSPLPIEENNITLYVDLLEGQKTGYYLDQARNRALARPLFAGRRVLDLFSYVGAWALLAADADAESVLAIDSSARALDFAQQALDGRPDLAPRVTFEKADVFNKLRDLSSSGEKFNAVILDPPPLAKSKRDAEAALRGYRELNLRAMQLLPPGGILLTFCCSHAVSEEEFQQAVAMAAKDSRADFSILERPAQPADHPVHLQTPETHYLKSLFLVKRQF